MGSSEVEVGIVCHLANGPEDRVYRAEPLYNRHSTHNFCCGQNGAVGSAPGLCVLGGWCRRSEVRVRGPTRTERERLATFQQYISLASRGRP